MKLRGLAIAAVVVAMAALVPASSAAAAQPASVRPAGTCFGYSYSYSISSTQIRASGTDVCGNGGIPYLVLERYDASIGGSYPWRFVASSSNGTVAYTCSGTTANTYHVGPIITPGGSSYTWYQFTDNCG